MDYIIGVDLLKLIQQMRKHYENNPLREEEARTILYETLLAMKSFHDKNKDVAHRDIRLNNIKIHFPELVPEPKKINNLKDYLE